MNEDELMEVMLAYSFANETEQHADKENQDEDDEQEWLHHYLRHLGDQPERNKEYEILFLKNQKVTT